MASSSHWQLLGSPHISFQLPNQSEVWSTVYTRALDYLDALDIELDNADEFCKGWKQLNLMFDSEDRKVLQSLIDSSVVTLEHILKPKAALDAIGTTIKSEEHFWAYRDELISDLQWLPDEGIHALSQCICDLITKSNLAMHKQLKLIKLWSCNMQSSIMRLGTGLGYRTSPYSCIRPSSPTVKCLKLAVSSTKRLRRGVVPIWPP